MELKRARGETYFTIAYAISPFHVRDGLSYVNGSFEAAEGMKLLCKWNLMFDVSCYECEAPTTTCDNITECNIHDFINAFSNIWDLAPYRMQLEKGLMRRKWLVAKNTIQKWVVKTLWKHRRLIRDGKIRHPKACMKLTAELAQRIPSVLKALLKFDKQFGYIIAASIDVEWRIDSCNFLRCMPPLCSYKYSRLMRVMTHSSDRSEICWKDDELLKLATCIRILKREYHDD